MMMDTYVVYWQYKSTGAIVAVEIRNGVIIGASDPVTLSQIRWVGIHFHRTPELLANLRAKQGEFVDITQRLAQQTQEESST